MIHNELRNSIALSFNETLDQNHSTPSINTVGIWWSEQTPLYFLLMTDWDEPYSTTLNVPLKARLAPAPPSAFTARERERERKKKEKISCPSMAESEPLFGGTMEDILLWRIASHSISRWRGAAAGRGQQGRWRKKRRPDPSGLLQTEALFTARPAGIIPRWPAGQEAGAMLKSILTGMGGQRGGSGGF